MKKARHYLGYRIVRRRKIGSVEYVIGHNPDALLPYACWNYNNGFIIWVTIANAIQRQDESFINGVATKETV